MMALGTSLGGWKVMKTMGGGVTKLTPALGFAAQASSAIVIELMTFLGAPVSTTQVITTSIMGVGSVQRRSAVKWGMAGNIFTAWVVTLPAAILLGGAVMLMSRTMNSSTKSLNAVARETQVNQVDSAMRLDGENRNLTNNKNASFSAGSAGKKKIDGTVINRAADGKKQEETIEGNEESDIKTYAPGSAPSEAPTEAEDDDVKKGDIKDSLPFKVKTVGTGSIKYNIAMTVYTGENGEKMILFKAPEGTDIVKAYYPDFKGVPALLQTEAGQVFKAVDTSAGRNVVVKNAGPFDAVTWTKDGSSYMIAFSKKTDTHVFISLMEMI